MLCCEQALPGSILECSAPIEPVKATLSHLKEVEDGYILLDVEHDGKIEAISN
jgi:hypothetical protein